MNSNKLASDLDNPDFVGAKNPDSVLQVVFYSKPMPNEFESNKQGRPIFYDADFVKIMIPGDKDSIIDTFAREDHKKRFPLHWAHYQNKHGGDSREIGTPLAQWPRLTASQAEELKGLKFFTVEAIAHASDAQLQKIGMAAGMAPYAFREHAQRFLALAQGDSAAQAAEEKAKQLEAEKQALVDQMAADKAETERKFAEMQAQIQALLPKPKRKYAKKATE